MFDKIEKRVNDLCEKSKKITYKILKVLLKVLGWVMLILFAIGIVVFIDFVGNEILDFNFMKPFYDIVKNVYEGIDWVQFYTWILNFIFRVISIVLTIFGIPAFIVLYIEWKDKVEYISKPTKARFLKLARNSLVFFVFFIALFDYLVADAGLKFIALSYGLFALIVTLYEDWIHKKRIPYLKTLEDITTSIVNLGDYFAIESTYMSGDEKRDEKAIVVSRGMGENIDYAIEYFTKHPYRSKMILVPINTMDNKVISYFCKVLNNMKLEFDPEKFKEFKVRVFSNAELYDYVNHINYDFLSGIERNKYLIQDIYYDIKHYVQLEDRDIQE